MFYRTLRHRLFVLFILFRVLTLIISMGLFWLAIGGTVPGIVQALDPVDELQQKINETQHLLDLSVNATKPLEAEVQRLANNIKSAENQMAQLRTEQKNKEQEIAEQEAEMSDQYALFSARVDRQYRFGRTYSPLVMLLSSQTSQNRQALKFTLTLAERDQQTIDNIGEKILSLQQAKKEAEEQEKRLASLQTQLDQQKQFFEKEIAGAKEYQATLENKIAQLSAQQQAIINARSGGFLVNLTSDFGSTGKSSRQHFLNEAPSGSFAVFSFGAYSHRNGMSQYGALGRSKNGQSAEQILKYYYQGVELKTVDTNKTIIVDGTNTYGQTFSNESYQLEDYLKHIYEIPASWPEEVLKAQAIAARTYAYDKSTICPGQNCQEFKREENSDAWKQAVEKTKGVIMTGGSGNRQYSSTTGGWINGTGWDTTDNGGGNNFLEKSYEVIGGSPWVYSAWYVDVFGEWGAKGGTCGRSNPWLNSQEMADIVNAHLVMTRGDSSEVERVRSTSSSCWGGNPYSIDELKNIASKYGGLSEANSVQVQQGEGRTNTVTINNVQMTGDEFCKAFNLRAPGYLRIPQWSGNNCKGAFFNIERK